MPLQEADLFTGRAQPLPGKELEMAKKKSCDFQDKNYPDGGSVCVGDQCIQCSDGKWGPNKYELKARRENLKAGLGK